MNRGGAAQTHPAPQERLQGKTGNRPNRPRNHIVSCGCWCDPARTLAGPTHTTTESGHPYTRMGRGLPGVFEAHLITAAAKLTPY